MYALKVEGPKGAGEPEFNITNNKKMFQKAGPFIA